SPLRTSAGSSGGFMGVWRSARGSRFLVELVVAPAGTIGDALGTFARGSERAPATRRARPLDWRCTFDAQFDLAVDAVERAPGSSVEDAHRDVFGLGLAGVEVERCQLARRHPGPQRLDEGIEAQVVTVTGGDVAGLQVDDHLAALTPDLVGADQQVDLARQDDRPVEWLLDRRLRTHLGGRRQGRETLLEVDDPLDRGAAQQGP